MIAPGAFYDDPPVTAAGIGARWLGYVLGALEPLTRARSWTGTPAQIDHATQQAEAIMRALVLGEVIDVVPVGTILMFGGVTPPAGWLLCDGATIADNEYPALHTVLNGAYGIVFGVGQRLPDFRGRVPVGSGTGAGLSPRARGQSFGTETHTLTVSEMPEHRHEVQARDSSSAGTTNRVMSASATGVNKNTENMMNPAGGGVPHNNMQPSLVVNYIIRAE